MQLEVAKSFCRNVTFFSVHTCLRALDLAYSQGEIERGMNLLSPGFNESSDHKRRNE